MFAKSCFKKNYISGDSITIFLLRIILVAFLLNTTMTGSVQAGEKISQSDFMSFYTAYFFSKVQTISEISGLFLVTEEQSKMFQYDLRTAEILRAKAPKITKRGVKVQFNHASKVAVLDFSEVHGGAIKFNGEKIMFSSFGSYAEARKLASRVLGRQGFSRRFVDFYGFLFFGLGKVSQYTKAKPGIYSWLDLFYRVDSNLLSAQSKKKAGGRPHIALGYSCSKRAMKQIWSEELNFETGLTKKISSMAYDVRSRGYILRIKPSACATYLTNNGVVRASYPKCPPKNSNIFGVPQFFNFAKIVKSCCISSLCGNGLWKRFKGRQENYRR